jgi:hypothetical protein
MPGEPECEQTVEHAASQKRIENTEQRRNKNCAAKTMPRADPRHQFVFDTCYQAYEAKYTAPPTWGGKEGKLLQAFLKEHPGIAAEEIARRYRNFLRSTDRWHAEKHGSFSHLLKNFDQFAESPISATPQKGKTNGTSISDRMRTTIEGYRIREQSRAN